MDLLRALYTNMGMVYSVLNRWALGDYLTDHDTLFLVLPVAFNELEPEVINSIAATQSIMLSRAEEKAQFGLTDAASIHVDVVDFYCSTFGEIPGAYAAHYRDTADPGHYLDIATSDPVTEIAVMMIEGFRDLDGYFCDVPPAYMPSVHVCADQVLNPSVFDYGGSLEPDEQSAAFTPHHLDCVVLQEGAPALRERQDV